MYATSLHEHSSLHIHSANVFRCVLAASSLLLTSRT